MRDFVFLIGDDRREQPSLMLVSAVSEARARQIAERILAESSHRLSVEVWEDEARLFVVRAAGGAAGEAPRPID